mmetsp:Transcript_55724/g.122351  ORF Transcript_55724/g.122351 Transcript_55724/m.122351 type:complete len:229 (-) Transcript_55724:660-1346(-)
MPSAVHVSARTEGCWLERSATAACTVARELPPVALPSIPKATTAEDTTRTSLSEKSFRSPSSLFTAAVPIIPSALAADARTSGLVSSSNAATLSTYIGFSFSFRHANACAAAHFGIRTAGAGLPMTQAAPSIFASASSESSPSIAAMLTQYGDTAFSPMVPSTTAAAHFTPGALSASNAATSLAMGKASVPKAQNTFTAVPRTTGSESERHLQISLPYAEATDPIWAK